MSDEEKESKMVTIEDRITFALFRRAARDTRSDECAFDAGDVLQLHAIGSRLDEALSLYELQLFERRTVRHG